jgi:murein DD-endopeptidase MepM/ murein hydrolase activator NlpD
MKLKYPTNFIGITKGFRPKKYPTHSAIDLGWNSKFGGAHVPVYACADGEVTSIRDGRGNTMVPGDSGNYVTVAYGTGEYETRVCHLEKGSIKVQKGDKVTTSTVLGRMGNSGYCGTKRGCHVHYIVWYKGSRVNPIHHTYVYPDQVVAASTSKEYSLLYCDNPAPEPEPSHTMYVRVTAKSGVWARKGIGFSYGKYVAIPYGAEFPLIKKDAGKKNGYTWDKVLYNGEELYMPDKWNAYFTR